MARMFLLLAARTQTLRRNRLQGSLLTSSVLSATIAARNIRIEVDGNFFHPTLLEFARHGARFRPERQIRRGIHRSVFALKTAITTFIERHNASPELFMWTIRRRHPRIYRTLLRLRHPAQTHEANF
jgi:hypothetical protein